MSRRGDIAAAIKERFQSLENFIVVERWRDTTAEPFAIDDTPAINFKDSTGNVDNMVSTDEHRLDVTIDIITVSTLTATDVEDRMSEILAAIAGDEFWGSLADGTNIESHDIDLTSEMSETISAGRIRLTINYTTEKGQI